MQSEQNTHFLKPHAIIAQLGIEQGMCIVDLGCGTGYMSFAASPKVGERGIVYAVDVQKVVLEQVKREALAENMLNIQALWSDIESVGALTIPAASADVVFLVNVLFEIQNKKNAIGEAVRLVKPGGRILVIDWKPGNIAIGPSADKRINIAEIDGFMQEYGLTILGPIEAGEYHIGKLYQKP